MSATVILAKMEELAPTVMEVIHANVKMGGQALIVNKNQYGPSVGFRIETMGQQGQNPPKKSL